MHLEEAMLVTGSPTANHASIYYSYDIRPGHSRRVSKHPPHFLARCVAGHSYVPAAPQCSFVFLLLGRKSGFMARSLVILIPPILYAST